MKVQLIGAILLISMSQFSSAAFAKPDSCPSISALKAVGVTQIVHDEGLWYGAVQSAKYDTNDNWTFTIGQFEAKNEHEAKAQALNALSSLTLEQGPVSFTVEGIDSSICLYKDHAGHTAGTVTPIMNISSKFLKF